VSDRSIDEFRFAYETYHTRILVFRKIRTRTVTYSILAYTRISSSLAWKTTPLTEVLDLNGLYSTSVGNLIIIIIIIIIIIKRMLLECR